MKVPYEFLVYNTVGRPTFFQQPNQAFFMNQPTFYPENNQPFVQKPSNHLSRI